jgi:hypothetical protein
MFGKEYEEYKKSTPRFFYFNSLRCSNLNDLGFEGCFFIGLLWFPSIITLIVYLRYPYIDTRFNLNTFIYNIPIGDE